MAPMMLKYDCSLYPEIVNGFSDLFPNFSCACRCRTVPQECRSVQEHCLHRWRQRVLASCPGHTKVCYLAPRLCTEPSLIPQNICSIPARSRHMFSRKRACFSDFHSAVDSCDHPDPWVFFLRASTLAERPGQSMRGSPCICSRHTGRHGCMYIGMHRCLPMYICKTSGPIDVRTSCRRHLAIVQLLRSCTWLLCPQQVALVSPWTLLAVLSSREQLQLDWRLGLWCHSVQLLDSSTYRTGLQYQ